MRYSLFEIPTPSVVLDLTKMDVNCERMLERVKRLEVGRRSHIKTHKLYYVDELYKKAFHLILTLDDRAHRDSSEQCSYNTSGRL